MDAQTDDKSKTKDLHGPSRFTWIKTKQFLLIAYSQNGKLVESRLHYKTIKTTTYSSRKAILRGVPIWFTARPSRPVHLGDVSRSSLDERPLGPESTMHVNPLSPQLSQEHLLQCGNGSSVRKKGYSRIRHYVQKPSKGRSPVKSTEKHTAWICLYVLYSIPTES